jgi:hypothetical protein
MNTDEILLHHKEWAQNNGGNNPFGELNPESNPLEIIDFKRLCKMCYDIQRFHQTIKDSGRKPIVAEYLAIKEYHDNLISNDYCAEVKQQALDIFRNL